MRTTEQTIHAEVLGAYLTNPLNAEGLGWVSGKVNQVEPNGLIRSESLYRFLRNGNAANAQAWSHLVKFTGSQVDAEKAALTAVQTAIDHTSTLAGLLRQGVEIGGLRFDLWNRPAGRGTMASQLGDFARNEFITVAELPIAGPAILQEMQAWDLARGKLKNVKDTLHRRPDQAFYVNGILFSLLEVKARQTRQTASNEGRSKLAGDFRSFAFGALQRVRHEFELAEGRPWPGIAASRNKLSSLWRRRVMALMGSYAKTSWLAVMDMKELWLAPEPQEWLALCDRSLGEMLAGRQGSTMKKHPCADMDKLLNAQMIAGFSRMPDITGTDTAWDTVKTHLEGLLSAQGVAREISLWHYSARKANRKDAASRSLMRPRAPQRAAIHQALNLTQMYYSHEHDPLWSEMDLRDRLARSLPSMSAEQVEQVIQDRLKYRNGQDAYSVLIQGAAGLGKTHIAVCLGVSLYNMLAPLPPGSHPATIPQPLFDRIVILTDRVELRKNIADEAQRSGASRGQVLEVDDQPTLVAALTGDTLPKGKSGTILVVNMQKFPSLAAAIKGGEIKMKHTVGRTAFIIDEVHRSQSGDLNEAATQAFLNEMSELTAGGQAGRKNLVIGLTATPTDTILARFGQWRPGVGASDQARWVPHFAYAMRQAIEDGYVLDPMRGLVKLVVPLDIETTNTLAKAGNASKVKLSSEALYEHEGRQRLVAKRFAEIFVGNTMLALPHGYRGVRTGRGKAMITVPSIRAAISMAEFVRDALHEIADKSEGQAWESYADIIEEVADHRVFVLYSKPGTGQGSDLGECGRYNSIPGISRHPTESEIVDGFRCKNAGSQNEARNSIIVVVDKLLTGFDEPTLHTFMIARSLRDVGLFQAMCRPNRTADGKNGCLIIDASHGEDLMREARRVFARYGNLATSDLDGLELLDRIKERRQSLLRWPDLKQAWRGKKLLTSGERAEDRDAWAAQVCKEPAKMLELKRIIGGYLADLRLARNLMRMEKEDLNEDWVAFLREIYNHFRTESLDTMETADIVFDVVDIGLDDMEFPTVDAPPSEEGKKGNGTGAGAIVDDWMDGEDALVDQIDRLRALEEERALRSASVQAFIEELFTRIDARSKAENNDAFRRSLRDPHHVMPHNEAAHAFKRLFDAVVGDRSWITKTDMEKRRYRDLARGRWELLLGDYRMRATSEAG